jgi:hypothetical protein
VSPLSRTWRWCSGSTSTTGAPGLTASAGVLPSRLGQTLVKVLTVWERSSTVATTPWKLSALIAGSGSRRCCARPPSSSWSMAGPPPALAGCHAEERWEEPSMICRSYDVPGATLDQYDAVDRQLGPGGPGRRSRTHRGQDRRRLSRDRGLGFARAHRAVHGLRARPSDAGGADSRADDHRVRGPQARLGPGLTTELGGELRLSGAGGRTDLVEQTACGAHRVG